MTKNAAIPRAKSKALKAGTTAAEVLDLVEYAINESKPHIKTSRGAGCEMEVKIGRRKFTISVSKARKTAKKISLTAAAEILLTGK